MNLTVVAFPEVPYVLRDGITAIKKGVLETSLITLKRYPRGPCVDYLAILLSVLGVKRFNYTVVPWVYAMMGMLENGSAQIGTANLYMTAARSAVITQVDAYHFVRMSTLLHAGESKLAIDLLTPYRLPVWILGTACLAILTLLISKHTGIRVDVVVHKLLFYKRCRQLRKSQCVMLLLTVWSCTSITGLSYYKSIFCRNLATRGLFVVPYRTVDEALAAAEQNNYTLLTYQTYRDYFCDQPGDQTECYNNTYPSFLKEYSIHEFQDAASMLEFQSRTPGSASFGLDIYHVRHYVKLYPHLHALDLTDSYMMHLSTPVSKLSPELSKRVKDSSMKILEYGLMRPVANFYLRTYYREVKQPKYEPVRMRAVGLPAAFYAGLLVIFVMCCKAEVAVARVQQ